MLVTILSNRGSRSAANLARSLGDAVNTVRIGRASPDSRRSCRTRRLCINLGVGTEPTGFQQRELIYTNTPEAVRNCADKRETFVCLTQAQVPHISWAVPEGLDVQRLLTPWLEQDGKIVVRHTTTGHSGRGIEIFRQRQLAQGQEVPNAPLYTRYFRKDAEYRVHVAFGRAILIQQKRKRDGVEQQNDTHLIRTHANGWVFTVNALSCDVRGYHDQLVDLAHRAANAVGAQHCAVDVLVRHEGEHTTNMVVCEINSCPALEANTTLAAYTEAFANHIRGLQ